MTDWLREHLLPCAFKEYLNVECPGCGMQRAFIALLEGDLSVSLSYNISLIPFILLCCFSLAHITFCFKNGARIIVFLSALTGSLMIANFVVKLVCTL